MMMMIVLVVSVVMGTLSWHFSHLAGFLTHSTFGPVIWFAVTTQVPCKESNINLYSTFLESAQICNKGITQFYLSPTRKPYLPCIPVRWSYRLSRFVIFENNDKQISGFFLDILHTVYAQET